VTPAAILPIAETLHDYGDGDRPIQFFASAISDPGKAGFRREKGREKSSPTP
jgi:hypothetical protein